MNIKSWITLLLAAITFELTSAIIFSQRSNAENPYPRDRVSFYCGEFFEQESGTILPATVAYVPQRKATIAIIAWKSNYIPAWDARRRCEIVSPRFQEFYEDGRLNYITTGINQGYDIVCAAINKGKPCNPENQLFQIKATDNPEVVLQGLIGIIEGTVSEPIYQNSGDQIYVSMEELLKNAPAIEEANLTSN